MRAPERGFVLIGVIWLLLLGGALVALIMLQGVDRSRAAAGEAEDFQRQLALDGAVETVIADRLLNGVRGTWGRLPAQGAIPVGGLSVSVEVTSENGRLDLNTVDPQTFDDALRGLGVAADRRQLMRQRIAAQRASGQPLRSWAEALALIAPLREAISCLDDLVTLYSGLPKPAITAAPAALAAALAGPARGEAELGFDDPMSPNTALRIVAHTDRGASRMAIVRITGLLNDPVMTMVIGNKTACE